MQKNPFLLGIVASTLLVAAIVLLLISFDWHLKAIQLLEWLNARGTLVSLLFILIMALAVVLLLPGIFFTTGAGFVFGVVKGTLYVVLGTTLGAVIAFLIARHGFGEAAARWLKARAKAHALVEEIGRHDWRVVMLTRLVPFFPFKLSNYFFGLTPLALEDFALGTAIGIIPFSLHNVYLGAMAALGVKGASPWQWLLYGMGFAATVALLVYLNRIARAALQYETEQPQGSKRCG
jgi:uncharacterized membrane protein YdjX (TVP38/TMEM64 family)